MGTKALMTVEDFVQMETEGTERYELVDGEPIQLPSPTPAHGRVCARLIYRFVSYLERNPIGEVYLPVDCRLGVDTVRQPDLCIFLAERAKRIDQSKVPIPFAPEIAVEVISPSETAIDVTRKVRDFLGAGSLEVWLLDHINREIVVHSEHSLRLIVGDDPLETPLLPGFSVRLGDLFTS